MGAPPKHTVVDLCSGLSLCWAGRLGDPAVPASFSSADPVGKAMRERDTISLKAGEEKCSRHRGTWRRSGSRNERRNGLSYLMTV